MAAKTDHRPITVTHEGGLKFAAQIRTHRLLVDQPVHSGGEDSAPSPIELLGASLGTCVALYVQQFCHVRGVSSEGFRVEVDTQRAANPSRIGQFNVRVVLPAALPSHYAEMIERVARSCPAHNTLGHGAQIHMNVERESAHVDASA